jgi:hypothetical protein
MIQNVFSDTSEKVSSRILQITLFLLSRCDNTYSTIGSALLNYAPLGPKTISIHSHFENNSSPHISGSGSLIRIKMYLASTIQTCTFDVNKLLRKLISLRQHVLLLYCFDFK